MSIKSINLYGLSDADGWAAQVAAAAEVRAGLPGRGWVYVHHGIDSPAARNMGDGETAVYHWRDGQSGEVMVVAWRKRGDCANV